MFRFFASRKENGDREGGFAMVFTLLVVLMVTALSVGVAGIVAGQVQPTQLQNKTTATLDDAETGLQVALSQIRNAVNSNATGKVNVTALPCTASSSSAAVAGSLLPSGDNANNAYNVTVRYYDQTQGQIMLANADNPSAVASKAVPMTCSQLANVNTTPPSYAYLYSNGSANAIPGHTAAQGNRNLHLVYRFSTSTPITIGGLINQNGLCWQADPNTGVVTMASCAGTIVNGVLSITNTVLYQSQQFQAASAGNGKVMFVFGGDPSANKCLADNGLNVLSLVTCNSADSTQQFTLDATNNRLVSISNKCVNAAGSGAVLGLSTCTTSAGTTVQANANVGLATASVQAGVTASGGLTASATACALPTNAFASGCVVGASASAVADPATGTYAVSISVSLFGLTMCATAGVSGFMPVLGLGFGSSCLGSTSATTTTVASPSTVTVSAPAPSYASIQVSIQPVGQLYGGENTNP